MKAPRFVMFAAVALILLPALALAQMPVPATAPPAPTGAPAVMPATLATLPSPAMAPMPVMPAPAPARFAAVPQVAPTPPMPRPAQAPMSPRATVRPEIAMEPPAPPDVADDQVPPPPPPPPAPGQAPKVAMPVPAPAAVAQAAPKVVRAEPRKMIAVKVEFTITDQLGSKPPTKKSMAMTIGSGEFSRIRTNASYFQKVGPSTERRQAPLSIDVRPSVEGNKIWVDFTLEYNLLDDPPAEGIPGGNTSVSESLAVVLDSGVPLVVAQSSDALSDRKITIEVKATIMK